MEQRIAGTELDLEIHSRIFGRRLLSEDEMRAEAEGVWATQPNCVYFLPGFTAYRDPVRFVQRCPRYSTDIAAAWTVAEKLADDGFVFSVYYDRRFAEAPHIVRLSRIKDSAPPVQYSAFEAEANGAPLAICLAALECVKRTTIP